MFHCYVHWTLEKWNECISMFNERIWRIIIVVNNYCFLDYRRNWFLDFVKFIYTFLNTTLKFYVILLINKIKAYESLFSWVFFWDDFIDVFFDELLSLFLNETIFVSFNDLNFEIFKCWSWSTISLRVWTISIFDWSIMMFFNELINESFDDWIDLSTFLLLIDEVCEELLLIVNSNELKNSTSFEVKTDKVDEDFDSAFYLKVKYIKIKIQKNISKVLFDAI
jgi:hypothetical protein